MIRFFSSSNPRPPRARVCFVTNELYPEDKGGIGRILYNFCTYNKAQENPVEIHFLIGGHFAGDRDKITRITKALDGLAKIHVVPQLTDMVESLPNLLGWAGRAMPHGLEGQIALSHSYYEGLRRAEASIGDTFDIIEFPDFGGWGMVSMEAKRAGIAFQDTQLSVRVHSTQGLLYRVERFAHMPGNWLASQFDAERFTLTHADLVVGHIPSVLHANLDHYDLRDALVDKTIIEFPPILLDGAETKRPDREKTQRDEVEAQDFIFSSRLQQFKRPDIFVRAAIEFLETYPEYQGTFRLVSYGWDTDYINMLHDLVPPAFASRILFIDNATPDERVNYIERSIVVQPSDYESLCLFAYEAAIIGQKVILNGDALAFGDFERWKDGENCLLFDGSVSDLVRQMQRALAWTPSATIETTPDTPYWLSPPEVSAPQPSRQDKPRVSVVCYGAEDLPILRRQMGNLARLQRRAVAQDIAIDATLLLSSAIFGSQSDELTKLKADSDVRLRFLPGHRFDPEKLQQTILDLPCEVAFLLPDHAEVYEEFFLDGVLAMHENPDLDLLGGHSEIYDETTGRVQELRAYGGQMPSTALRSSRILPETCFIRKSAFEKAAFDFRAGPLWFSAFARDAVLSNANLCVMPHLATRFLSDYLQRLENTIKLNAGIVDAFGIRNKLPARLLALGADVNHGEISAVHTATADVDLSTARLFSPTPCPVTWQPVDFNHEMDGLLVHPLKKKVTVARMPITNKAPKQISVSIRNNNMNNKGGEVAVAYGPAQIKPGEFLKLLDKKDADHRFSIGKWQSLPPGENINYSISISAPNAENGTLYLLTRPIKGQSGDNCHIVFSNPMLSFVQ